MTQTARFLLLAATLALSGCSSGEKVVTKEETYPDGKPRSKVEYHIKNGEEVLWGEATYYFPNGQLDTRIEHANGKKHGKYECFYDSGAPKSSGQYAFGRRDGEWTEWDAKGNAMKKHFKNGEEIKP